MLCHQRVHRAIRGSTEPLFWYVTVERGRDAPYLSCHGDRALVAGTFVIYGFVRYEPGSLRIGIL